MYLTPVYASPVITSFSDYDTVAFQPIGSAVGNLNQGKDNRTGFNISSLVGNSSIYSTYIYATTLGGGNGLGILLSDYACTSGSSCTGATLNPFCELIAAGPEAKCYSGANVIYYTLPDGSPVTLNIIAGGNGDKIDNIKNAPPGQAALWYSYGGSGSVYCGSTGICTTPYGNQFQLTLSVEISGNTILLTVTNN